MNPTTAMCPTCGADIAPPEFHPCTPPHPHTLDEASRNPDGTYNGIKVLKWLADVLTPKHGLTEEDIEQIRYRVLKKATDPK